MSYFDYMIAAQSSNVSWFSVINAYGGPGSAINAPEKDWHTGYAAYADRSSLWVLQHYAYISDTTQPFPESAIDFVVGLNKALTDPMPNTTFGAYLNYVDPSLTPDEAHEEYYGEELYAKLQGLKAQLDPKETFWNPQGIVPANSSSS